MNINQISQQELTDYIEELADKFKEQFGYPVFSQDNPCWNPFQNYCFLVDDNEGYFYIVSQSYWNANHHIEDRELDDNEIPEEFVQVMESCLMYDYDNITEGKQRLIDLGMTEVFE